MKWPASLLLVLVAAPVYAADDSTLLDLLPPNPQVVFGTHVHAVMDSALVHILTAQMEVSPAEELQKVVPVLGFDPLTDVDEILLASTGEGENPPVLIVARGKFDPARMAAHAKPYHDVPLVTESETAETGFAFLDNSTVLAGDIAAVKAAIDRRGTHSELSAALATRIADYRERFALWGLADHPGALGKRLASSGGVQAWDAIDRFQFGIALTHGLEVSAEVHPRSTEDVSQLTASLKLVEAMTQMSPASQNQGTKLSLTTDNDGTMKVSLTISEEQLKKTIQTGLRAQASPMSASRLRSGTSVKGAPVPAAPGQSTARVPAPTPALVKGAPVPAAPGQSTARVATPAPAPVRVQSSEPAEPKSTSAADPVVRPTSDSGTAVFTLPGRK